MKNIFIILSILVIFLFVGSSLCFAKHKHRESYYINKQCTAHNGKSEVTLQVTNKIHVRADCITNREAVEFDFAYKQAESFGQSQLYALLTGKFPAIVLILTKENDYKYVNILLQLLNKYEFSIYIIDDIGGDY